ALRRELSHRLHGDRPSRNLKRVVDVEGIEVHITTTTWTVSSLTFDEVEPRPGGSRSHSRWRYSVPPALPRQAHADPPDGRQLLGRDHGRGRVLTAHHEVPLAQRESERRQ